MWPFRSGLHAAEARETLRTAGYAGSFRGMRVIACSLDDRAGGVGLHATANRTLQKTILDGSAGNCIHVTGRMNALMDPYHRRLCAELARQGRNRFRIVCDGSVGEPARGRGAAATSARRWADAAWDDRLSAIRLIGEGLVDLRTGPTGEALRYTVFGGRYAQIRGGLPVAGGAPHAMKAIWLVVSEEVNGTLAEWAEATLARSRHVGEGEFREFFVRTNGVAAHDMLRTLCGTGPIHRSELLTSRLLDFDPGAGDILASLGDLGLVAEGDDGNVGITDGGRRFIAGAA